MARRLNRALPPLAIALLAAACDPEKALRNEECKAYSEWSNHAGDMLAAAVPDSDKSAAATNAQEAAIYRRLAAGARICAGAANPFKDPYVRDLAHQRLAIFDAVALALEHQAEAWQKGDKAAIQRALDEELAAQAKARPLADEWRVHCRL
jgi:hypothetical protein